jgi:hypothetical protein
MEDQPEDESPSEKGIMALRLDRQLSPILDAWRAAMKTIRSPGGSG